jgi:hypothetical protein
MADEFRIVLIPKMPGDIALSFVFRTEKGIAVRASDEQIQSLRSKGIPVLELYSSGNDYSGDMYNLTKDEALAAISALQDTRLALLSEDERSQFGVA